MNINDNTSFVGRRRLMQALAVGVAAPAFVTRSWAQAAFTMKIAHSEAIGSPLTNAFERWAKMISDRSAGQIDAQHFPASQLGGLAELLDGSRIGTIQATTAGPDSEESIAPEIAAFGGAPGFIYQDEAHVDRVLQGDLGKEISQIARDKTGVEFVAYGESGFRHLLAKQPVTDLASLKGLKMRVPQLRVWVDFWTKLGANPTPLPYSEQYSALSTGVIEGLESDYFSVLGFKWHEQATDVTPTYHWFLPKAVRVNAAWLDSLPADLQAIVRETAVEAFAAQRTENRAKADQALEDLKAVGCTVHAIDPNERAKWAELTEPLFDEFGSKSAKTAEMIAKIRGLANG